LELTLNICPNKTNSVNLIEKEVCMTRSISNLVRFIGNFRYYRRNGNDIKTAWHLAGMTLP
jgi:hypothetical protein